MKTPHDQDNDARLDAMLASTNDHMLAAISRRIDLDGRLDNIIGKPPLVQHPAAAADVAMASAHALLDAYKKRQEAAEENQDDLRSQILELIAQIDRMSSPVKRHFVLDTSVAQPLASASAELKSLERGLDARKLSREQADNSLRFVHSSLIQAADIQTAIENRQHPALRCETEFCLKSYRRWRGFFAALIALALISAASLSLTLFTVPAIEVSSLPFWLAPPFTFAVAAFRVWAHKLSEGSCARMHEWEPISGSLRTVWAYVGIGQARNIRHIHNRYIAIWKRVRRLFDETDDRSPEFAPRI